MPKKRNASPQANAMRPRRASIPPDVRDEVLRRCRRRCCVCFGLKGDLTVKEGQIAHLDENRANPRPENLAFLCQECHTGYDRRSNRVLGFTPEEVRRYRDRLCAALGCDRVEWTLTIRADRVRYREAKQAIDRAQAVLFEFSQDVSLREEPLERS